MDFVFFSQFVPKTHYFFSVSKDKTLKYWDADKFEHITTLQVKFCSVIIYYCHVFYRVMFAMLIRP